MQENEDKLIAESFLLVRQGILSEDWALIIKAYENISGEKLELPKKQKSRLELIRETMAALSEKGVKPEPSKESETVAEITSRLLENGFTKKQLKGKNKVELQELLKEEAPSSDTISDEDESIDVTITKEQGGKRFAEKGFQVISAGFDSSEAARNKKKSFKKTKLPRPENIASLVKQYNSADPNRSVGYHDTPKRPPEGR